MENTDVTRFDDPECAATPKSHCVPLRAHTNLGTNHSHLCADTPARRPFRRDGADPASTPNSLQVRRLVPLAKDHPKTLWPLQYSWIPKLPIEFLKLQ